MLVDSKIKNGQKQKTFAKRTTWKPLLVGKNKEKTMKQKYLKQKNEKKKKNMKQKKSLKKKKKQRTATPKTPKKVAKSSTQTPAIRRLASISSNSRAVLSLGPLVSRVERGGVFWGGSFFVFFFLGGGVVGEFGSFLSGSWKPMKNHSRWKHPPGRQNLAFGVTMCFVF